MSEERETNRNEPPENEADEVPLRPSYKIPKGAQEAMDELMGRKKITQDSMPKSAKIMKFM